MKTIKNKYEKTVLIDFDNYDGVVNGWRVPKGYRFLVIHHGYGDYRGWIDGSPIIYADDDCYEMMKTMAEGCYHNISNAKWLSKLFAEYPKANGQIDPEKDVIISWDADTQNAEAYLPPGLNIIWTDIGYTKKTIEEMIEKVAAAQFLREYLRKKRDDPHMLGKGKRIDPSVDSGRLKVDKKKILDSLKRRVIWLKEENNDANS